MTSIKDIRRTIYIEFSAGILVSSFFSYLYISGDNLPLRLKITFIALSTLTLIPLTVIFKEYLTIRKTDMNDSESIKSSVELHVKLMKSCFFWYISPLLLPILASELFAPRDIYTKLLSVTVLAFLAVAIYYINKKGARELSIEYQL